METLVNTTTPPPNHDDDDNANSKKRKATDKHAGQTSIGQESLSDQAYLTKQQVTAKVPNTEKIECVEYELPKSADLFLGSDESSPIIPSAEKLAGTYDIISCYLDIPEQDRHLILKGTLTLKAMAVDGKKDKAHLIHGNVAIDPTIDKSAFKPYVDNFGFIEKGRHEGNNSKKLKPIGSDQDQLRNFQAWIRRDDPCVGAVELFVNKADESMYKEKDEILGKLHIVGKQSAVGLLPCSNTMRNGERESSVKFDSIEEAESILSTHKDEKRPPPLLIFKKGDLCIHFDWSSGTIAMGTVLFARRQKSLKVLPKIGFVESEDEDELLLRPGKKMNKIKKCTVCRKSKGLAHYSKNQQRKSKAKCLDCVSVIKVMPEMAPKKGRADAQEADEKE